MFVHIDSASSETKVNVTFTYCQPTSRLALRINLENLRFDRLIKRNGKVMNVLYAGRNFSWK